MGKKLAGKKILKALDAPQRYVMGKAADAAGVKRGKDAEGTARNIVERVAKRAGLGDSTAANAAKAAGVAGLTVFGDPLSLIPGAKPAKMALKAAKKMPKGLDISKAFKTAPKASKNIDVEKGKAVTDLLSKKPANVAKKLKAQRQSKARTAATKLKEADKEGRIDKENLTPETRKKLESFLQKQKKEN